MLNNEIDMSFSYAPVTYGQVKTGKERPHHGRMHDAIKHIQKGETVADCMNRFYGKPTGYTHKVLWDDEVPATMIAGHDDVWLPSGNKPVDEDIAMIQTFPVDFDFCGATVLYICGMSVPPVMMKRVVMRLVECGLYDYKIKSKEAKGNGKHDSNKQGL